MTASIDKCYFYLIVKVFFLSFSTIEACLDSHHSRSMACTHLLIYELAASQCHPRCTGIRQWIWGRMKNNLNNVVTMTTKIKYYHSVNIYKYSCIYQSKNFLTENKLCELKKSGIINVLLFCLTHISWYFTNIFNREYMKQLTHWSLNG